MEIHNFDNGYRYFDHGNTYFDNGNLDDDY